MAYFDPAMGYPELQTTLRLDFAVDYFHTWKDKLDFVLINKDVDYVLTVPKPPENEVAGYKKWIRDDRIARYLIIGAMHERLYSSYKEHETAKSLMDALTATFTKPSMMKRMTKLSKYVGHKMAEGKPVFEHILEMGSMAGDLEREGLKIPEEVQTVMLMNSMPESWNDVVTSLKLSMDFDKSKWGEPDLGLDMVSRRLRDIGDMKELYRKREEEEAKRRRPHFKGHCFTCGEYGHHRNHCTM